ncbi:MAG: ATP-binding protein [Acidobacteriia bacterium]|nr:ATP-binding protein [Terriglobia bacterium]
MSSPQLTSNQSCQEQFRICKLQVFNWGTFSGLHTIPINEKGFLFAGRSGAGKSTLLDAFSALLIPPRWIDFNAAAREAERTGRDRSFVSYIRGAWAEQKDDESGAIAQQYLRVGTTWSALALTYRNAQEQIVVLVRVFWIRGNSCNSADVRYHFFIFERPFDLLELREFDLDIRKLKQSFPDAFARDDFRPYCDHFCRLLGIEHEMALRLLHKTQSAKNLGDLNVFLRDFMLERPATFQVAERLVSEFTELNAAHQAVVIAREQVQTLTPARTEHQRLLALNADQIELDSQRAGLDTFCELSRIALLRERISELNVQLEAATGEVSSTEKFLDAQHSVLLGLEQQHRNLGGDRVEQWEAEKESLERLRKERSEKRDHIKRICVQLGWKASVSPQEFAELAATARREIENWHQNRKTIQEELFDVTSRKKQTENEWADALREIAALKRQRSNMPASMLDLRRQIAEGIGVQESLLPFAGELLEVLPEESSWRGAVERLLRGLALSLLVEDRYYAALSNYINGVNLGMRLVYHRTTRSDSLNPRPVASNSVFLKIKIKDSEHAEWLRSELRQRFDYACVDSMQAFRNAERALTLTGQIRHGKSHHEKDDRRGIDDPRYWCLGFDNREKLALYERQAQELGTRITELETKGKQLSNEEERQAIRAMQCQALANVQWHEVDVEPLIVQIAAIDRQLSDVRDGNADLQQIGRRIATQKQQIRDAETDVRNAKVKWQDADKDIKSHTKRLEALLQEPGRIELTDRQRHGLESRFSRVGERLSLDNLDKHTRTVLKAIGEEDKSIGSNVHECERKIENAFADFKRRWPMDASNMDSTLASAADFFALLSRLELDGLPAHEQRFFDLLQNQSHQNLVALSTHLNRARKEILERMELVNESLSNAEFNSGTRLVIEVSDRQLPEVREFKQEIQQVLSHAWGDDRQIAEERFINLRTIVERLASHDPEQKHWREAVLDVRHHVEFIGREIDADGTNIEVYRSGAGKSGGQRQKLATTCLAAALRYQLGGNDQGMPVYAPVVLDEAFDKTDNEFTTLCMNIFTNFGFQMIVATPLKSVMTLEPFIGGACFIEIADRRNSGILMIEYDQQEERLKLPERARAQIASEVS